MSGTRVPLVRRATAPVQNFLAIESAAGILLLAATVLSLIVINSPLGEPFKNVLDTHVGITVGTFHLEETVHDWINEALMTIFFFVAGLEIKRELTNGELANRRKAALPVLAAAGGMIVPAVIFTIFNSTGDYANGWAIPMATDIAFALGVVMLAGSRVPPAAKIFLLSLAIADDVFSIIVMALFYSSDLAFSWLFAAIAGLGVTFWLRRSDVRSIPVYLAAGAFIWVCVLESGVPPTLVGVAMGLLAPARHHPADGRQPTVTARIEHALHPWSSFAILPIFALANAGLVISADALSAAVTSPVTIGIVLARTLGKAIGIAGTVWICVRLGIATLPTATTWRHINGMAIAAGAGFTVCLLITDLAFGMGVAADQAKIGILVGTVISAVAGLAILRTAPKFASSSVEIDPATATGLDELRAGAAVTPAQQRVPQTQPQH